MQTLSKVKCSCEQSVLEGLGTGRLCGTDGPFVHIPRRAGKPPRPSSLSPTGPARQLCVSGKPKQPYKLKCWTFFAGPFFLKVHKGVPTSEETLAGGGRRKYGLWSPRVPEGTGPSPKNKQSHQRLRWGLVRLFALASAGQRSRVSSPPGSSQPAARLPQPAACRLGLPCDSGCRGPVCRLRGRPPRWPGSWQTKAPAGAGLRAGARGGRRRAR